MEKICSKIILKSPFEVFKKNKLSFFINLAGLVIGFTCVIVLFLWIQNEISYDRFHEHGNHIYQIIQESKTYPMDSDYAEIDIPNASVPVLIQEITEIVDAARIFSKNNCLVRFDDKKYHENNLYFVDPSFFKMFSFPFYISESIDALSNKHDIVISEKISQNNIR